MPPCTPRAWRTRATASTPDSTPYFARANRGLAFAQPAGPWGYIGTALAAQYGFTAPSDSNDAQSSGPPATPAASLPAGAQAAAGKCINIVAAFNIDQFATSLAGTETMNDDIGNDAVQDPDFKEGDKGPGRPAWPGTGTAPPMRTR